MGFRGCLNDLFFVFFWLYWIYATLTETIDFRLRYKKIEAFNNKLCFWKWQPWLLLQGSFAAVLLLVLQLLWNFREPLQNRLFFFKKYFSYQKLFQLCFKYYICGFFFFLWVIAKIILSFTWELMIIHTVCEHFCFLVKWLPHHKKTRKSNAFQTAAWTSWVQSYQSCMCICKIHFLFKSLERK